MENTASKSENTILRQKVEELLKKKHLQPGTQLSACETNTLLHEMEVNQIELEMQNEELKLARYATQDAIELYDFAPSAFFTLNRAGEIVTINLSGAKMLGMEPTCLKNYSIDLFISEETKTIFNHFLRKLFNSKTKEYCEIIFSVNGNLPVNIYLSGIIKENNEECLITAIDITERKTAEKKLQDSEEFLKETQLIANLGTYTLEIATGKWVSSNVIDDIFGINADFDKSIEGWASIIHPEWKNEMMNYFENEVLGNKTKFDKEYKIIRQNDKAERWVHGIGKLKLNENSQPVTMVGAIQDITHRKMADEALRESEEKYRFMFANNPQPMWIYDLETLAFLEVNEKAIHHYGYSREEFLMMTLKDIHAEEDIPSLLKDIELARNTSNPGGKWKNIKKNGTIIFVEITSHSVIFNGRKARHVLVNDITERKKSDEEASKFKQQFNNLVSKIPVGVYVLHSKPDETFVLDYASPVMAEMFNQSVENLLSDAHIILQSIHPEDMESFEKLNLEGIQLHRPFNWKGRILFNEKVKWLHFRSFPELQSNGDILWHGLVTDITENVRTEEEIKHKNEELLKIVAEKDKFFSIISHDLRSPFNSFLGLTQIMAEELSSLTMDEIQKFAVSMRNSASNLFRLLENLLEWSRLQRGLIPFFPEEIKLLPIVDESIEMIREIAKNKQIKINYDIPYGITVFADRNILQTIIRNLVSNAVKFTPKGGSVCVSAKSFSGNAVEIAIIDSGIGINKDMMNNLFRFDINTSRKGTEGENSTGLGLIICQGFIEKHNGQLRVESEEGKGSTFYITLPGKVKIEEKNVFHNIVTADEAEIRMKNLKILIADDDEISGMLITMVVKRFCREVLKARTGIEVIDICRNNPDIDLILLDIQMPEMDGYQAAIEIRKMNPDIIIIAQTAFAFSEDREKAIASGCDDFITKPVIEDELKQKVLKLLKTR